MGIQAGLIVPQDGGIAKFPDAMQWSAAYLWEEPDILVT